MSGSYNANMAGKPNEMGAVGRRVAENVRRLRLYRGLTTAALSQRLTDLGWPILATGITKIEKAARHVDVDDLAALASALDVGPDALLSSDFVLVPAKPEGAGGTQGASS